jgi:glycosyltransferase involved in cell wall biosynthesis
LRARLRVIPFGADHVPEAAPEAAPPFAGAPFLLAIGTLEPRKNHAALLRAWRTLPAPRPRLVVIGRAGWLCAETVAALRAAAPDGCTWLPRADDATLVRFLAHARALVYPSRYEGFGFPPLEAARLGTPIVAGDAAAVRETLGDAAVFVDPDDTAALARALAELLADERARTSLGAAGRARAARFRWLDTARAYAEVYREAAA